MKKFFLASAVLIFLVFAVFLFLWRGNECYEISEGEARGLIDRIIADKLEGSKDGKVLFGYDGRRISYSSFTTDWGDPDLGSIDLTYSDSESRKPLFIARIYGSCEVEWLDISKRN